MFIMAENNPPPNASPSFRSWALPAANPMQSDRLYNVTQLISPPPEETLRRASVPFTPSLLVETPVSSSKRKRRTQPSASLPQQVTPNPKPRKYAKQLADPESPTRSTFDAIPTEIVISPEPIDDAASLKPRPRSRRSVTPIPPYEPPSVVLTSPREVMAAPTFTNKRKSKSKVHARPGSIKIIPVKKELPDIDLSVPMPPPSPTDDPILLSGPFGPPISTPSRPRNSQDRAFLPSVSESTQTDDMPSVGQNPFGDILDSEDLPYYDWRSNTRPDTLNTSDSLMDIRPSDADVPPVELPAFNLDDLPPSSDAWSDSDDDNRLETGQEPMEEGEGEYTGRWRTLLVKTKEDPPSSATRARMEQWGRPVSPFPEEAKSIQILDEEEEEQVQGSLNLEPVLDQDQQDEIDEEEVRRISVEPEGEDYAPRSMPSIIATSRHSASESRVSHTLVESQVENVDEASDGDNSDQETESFVKIMSADPRAAARAAAILKQYDYDCFTEITKSKRRRSAPDRMSRRGSSAAETLARRGVSEGRIVKDKAKKRASVGTGVIGSQVFISGAPVTTLRNLLDEVEAEVSFIGLPAKNAYETPVRCRSSLGVYDLSFVSSLLSQERGRHWTKDDWKLLDACFTDERFVIGSNLRVGGDGLADVAVIDLGHVVDRYISILGGEELVKCFGHDWERDAILQRARALRKKQRSGIVAPPTTPLSLQILNSEISNTPDIPDFTPLRAHGMFSRMKRPALLAPIMDNAPFQDFNIAQPVTPATFGERVKGFLFSYLPSMSKTVPHPSRKVHTSSQPGLPLPPHDLLAKPRGPITTPSRPPLPKAKHPKELVQLHPAPPPAPQTSLIPRLKPQRLVHLNPIPLPELRPPIPIVKPKNSTGSVKDLVRSFEELKKVRGGDKTVKPAWKP